MEKKRITGIERKDRKQRCKENENKKKIKEWENRASSYE